MTDETRGIPRPDGPPWSVDLLADLHEGLLDPQHAARLWPRVNADPQAREIIDALDSVKVALAELRTAPAPPMPAHVAARLDAALAEEGKRSFAPRPGLAPPPPPEPAPVVDLAEARRRRTRRLGWGAGLLTAAAAAVGIAFAALPGPQNTTDGLAEAEPSSSVAPPLALTTEDIGEVVGKLGGTKDYGPLEDQAGLDRCLQDNDIDPSSAQTVGVSPVTLDGEPGVLALLLTPQPGRFQVLVVRSDCTALFNGPIG